MYGMIHTAMRNMVLEEADANTWDRIIDEAGVQADCCNSMRQYSDEDTMSIVAAACKISNTDADQLLVKFGNYWIHKVAFNKYCNILNSFGSSLPDFLENLNNLHDRLSSTFPSFQPPVFLLERQPDCLLLTYISPRSGLNSFVQGLLEGLADHYRIKLTIDVIATEQHESSNKTVFRLIESVH